MTRGIYIIANDKVIEQAIALLNSVRFYDQDTPIALIPYNENYQIILQKLNQKHGVTLHPNLEFIERLSQKISTMFPENFFARPNTLRKFACWFGEFDEFLYIDTDIVVFEKIIDNLNYFQDYDFLCCDYQYKTGIKNVFTNRVIEDNIFQKSDLKDVFNSGFWGSKKGLFSQTEFYETLQECADHPDYFDFSYKTTDQPLLNYLMLRRIQRRVNLVLQSENSPGNWAGSGHFQRQDNILIDPKVNQPLQYLHWAGIKITPGCAYWDLWKYYRYLGEIPPSDAELTPKPQPSQSSLLAQVKKFLKGK